MAKKITIPREFGYPTADFFVEGIKYTYETGKLVSVDDKVAEIVANSTALDPKPGYQSSGDFFVVNVKVDSADNATCDKSFEELARAIGVGKNMVFRIEYYGSKVTNEKGLYITNNVYYLDGYMVEATVHKGLYQITIQVASYGGVICNVVQMTGQYVSL